MNARTWFGATVLGALATVVLVRSAPAPQERPSLVVMLVVDQLRADLIDRYADVYTGGFRRVLDQGFRYTSASHAHAVTQTAAGHATLSTGTFPSRSGIVANDWTERRGDSWASMYAVADADSPIVGVTDMPGRSPRNLLRSGLADWVLAADPEARVVSIAGKDRAAITLAAQSRSDVYWVMPEVGRFVTSTFYRSDYPDWVADFNRDVMPGIMADSTWTQEVPARFRSLARPDSADYEFDGVHSTFPHRASDQVVWTDTAAVDARAYNVWALEQPRRDVAVERLAERAIEARQLGQRGHVDFLALSFSSTDYVGHDYGPLSQEQLDNLYRLDRELGRLFDYLDEHVGRGRWIMGLSADHGVLDAPEAIVQAGGQAWRTLPRDLQGPLTQTVRDAAAEGTEPPDEFAGRIARALNDHGPVGRAYTIHDLTVGQPADSFGTLARNSWYPGRNTGWLSRYGVVMRYREHELVDKEYGTSHGSPYWYDRHVPLVLMGPGIAPGTSGIAAYTVDLAPTLARMAGIQAPEDLDGRPLRP